MTAVVFREFLEQNPHCQIVMVSRSNFAALFKDIPNLIFRGVDLDVYKGFLGMRKLARELITEFKPDQIADLHNVIRSKILNRTFKRKNFPVAVLNKGKVEKEKLTDVWNLEKIPLKPTFERYADVFRELGHPIHLSHILIPSSVKTNAIGLAPFAQHKGKMLPLERSLQIAENLSTRYKVYFFGGRGAESKILESWAAKIPNTENLAGKLSLEEELQQISELKLMISMDSANMHLASLVGTRCVSVWGATHYYAGFLGYGQTVDDAVEVKDLTCRPCSVFGDKECYRGDYACLYELHAEAVVEKVLKVLD